MFSYVTLFYTYEERNMKMVHGKTKEITCHITHLVRHYKCKMQPIY